MPQGQGRTKKCGEVHIPKATLRLNATSKYHLVKAKFNRNAVPASCLGTDVVK
uniref:Uncharacterized protein n=1 Tax=Zea mays TaxID=4577 RepID=C0HF81_MAIZE|nr:unknown [Zea mays]